MIKSRSNAGNVHNLCYQYPVIPCLAGRRSWGLIMQVRTTSSATIVKIPERFDTAVAHGIEQELTRIAGETTGNILCDFSGTRYISSAGLRALFVAQKKLRARQARLTAFGLSPYVREVFDISGFSQIIPLYTDESDALGDVGHSGGGKHP